MAIAVGLVLGHLVVDQRSNRYSRPVLRLRHNAIADRVERQPFVLGEETWLPRYGQTLVDDPSRDVVPGRSVALVENIIAGVTITHQGDPPAGQVLPGQPVRGR